MPFRILFIDTTHPWLPETLARQGFMVDSAEGWSYDDLWRNLKTYHGVVVRSRWKLDEPLLRMADNLRFIARVGAGMENIDVEYARKKGIVCLNAPEGNRDAVGEHTLGMLLALLNHLCRVDREVRSGIWLREENRGTEIAGKTAGIIGYGNMGSAFAEKLAGFNCRILAYDKYKQGYGNQLVTESDMETLFAEADIVSLHIPLTEETTGLVNADWVNRFAKPIYLLNTSRGKCVNTGDLLDAIGSGRIAGAALDVLEFEHLSFEKLNRDSLPDTFRRLIDCDKVLLSPHIAGWSHESARKMAEVIYRKILTALSL